MAERRTASLRASRVRRSIGAALCLVGAAGCVKLVAPPTPDELQQTAMTNVTLPPGWSAGGAAGAVESGWLATFDDARLQDLVAEAMTHNADLRAAAARVEQAAAYVRVAGGELYPAINALGRGGGEMSGDGSGLEGWLVGASWELDVWGRVRYGVRSTKEQYASAEADYAFARQSLAALVAKSWFLATETALQRALLAEMVTASGQLLQLAEERLRVGVGNELDVATARVSLQTYRDSARQVELAQVQSLRALELLLGRYPRAEVAVPAQFGGLGSSVPAGLPSELLERRPDVIAAQKRVSAAFNRVEQARAARLPRLSLNASVSSLTSELFVLEDREDPVWSIGGSILAPLFAGGALKAQVSVRTAEQSQAIAQYVQTALTAFGDVENALSSEAALQDRQTILETAVEQAQRALQIAETRYRVGSDDLRRVQEQQIAYLTSRMNLIRVLTEQRVQRVNLHLALGGDFMADA
jgi:NodT family efflux transporter outer membrane factor (OMF) lipoprotein